VVWTQPSGVRVLFSRTHGGSEILDPLTDGVAKVKLVVWVKKVVEGVKHVVVGGVGPVYPKIPGQFMRDDTKPEGLNVEVASAAVDRRNMTERIPQRDRKLLKACIMLIVFEGPDILLKRWCFVVKYSLLSCVVVVESQKAM
jgi:hypothetical protein